MVETERRFLIKTLPDLSSLKSLAIEDKMLLTGEDHPHLRLRRKGDHLMLTKKAPKEGGTGLEMIEEIIELSEIEYQLFATLKGIGQCKTRYYVPLGKYEAELDVWHKELSGLAILEVEFPSKEEAEAFTPPEFCGQEITGTEFEWLAGGKVAGKTFSDLEEKLKKLGYQKLQY